MTMNNDMEVGEPPSAEAVEAMIAAAVERASHELSRSESFDDEQRAEMYTILEAIKADGQAHREIVGTWINDLTGKVSHV